MTCYERSVYLLCMNVCCISNIYIYEIDLWSLCGVFISITTR
uniref:Uncharacterized protein n=1 Tax=viral metagenome TaxID=1070528 RepID=A0A6C0M045_9ZZZZ